MIDTYVSLLPWPIKAYDSSNKWREIKQWLRDNNVKYTIHHKFGTPGIGLPTRLRMSSENAVAFKLRFCI